MKINLAENMLRFGVKNLNGPAFRKVKTLAEQDQVSAPVEEVPGVQLSPLNVKSLAPITAIYGNGPADYLVKNWNTLKPGYIHLPSALGVLTCLVKDPSTPSSGVKNAVLSFISFTQVKPITVTVPAAKTRVKDVKLGTYDKAGTVDVTFTLLSAATMRFEGDNTWLEIITPIGKGGASQTRLAGGKAPGLPKFPTSTTYTWEAAIGDGVTPYYVGRPTGKIGSGVIAYDKLMSKFIIDQVTTNFTDANNILNSSGFTAYAKTVNPKPGNAETVWANIGGNAVVKAVYTAVGSAPTQAPVAQNPIPAPASR